MKKSEKLHGRAAFREVLTKGERLETELVRCSFLRRHMSNTPIQAGIIVSGRGRSAVERNRVKRLLREAFSGHQHLLADAVRTTGRSAILVFVFKGGKDLPVKRIQLSHIQQDIATCCKALAVRL